MSDYGKTSAWLITQYKTIVSCTHVWSTTVGQLRNKLSFWKAELAKKEANDDSYDRKAELEYQNFKAAHMQ